MVTIVNFQIQFPGELDLMVNNYVLDGKYLVLEHSSPKGSQEKYFDGEYWYKVDKVGREGKVEELISRLLGCSSLNENSYVVYSTCCVNGKSGCRSKSFLGSDEEFLNFSSLYDSVYGSDLENDLFLLRDTTSRLGLLLNTGKQVGVDLYDYFKRLLFLDMLILNRDRHSGNYGVIYNKNGYFREAPIFDNGQSLMTGLSHDDIVSSKTISGSFEDQVVAFGYPLKSPFTLNYSEILSWLEQGAEENVLKSQLLKYRGIFEK